MNYLLIPTLHYLLSINLRRDVAKGRRRGHGPSLGGFSGPERVPKEPSWDYLV